MLNHKHLLVKVEVANPIKSEETLKQWFIELVSKVNMKMVCGPTVKYVPSEGKEGLTGSINIETSHASIHIWDSTTPPYLQFDLYSCSDFDPKDVFKHIDDYMKITNKGYFILIDRNDEVMRIIDSGYVKRDLISIK